MQFSVQVRFRSATGIPADDVVNTWSFVGAGLADEAHALEATQRLDAFYSDLQAGGNRVITYYPEDVLSGVVDMSVYDITDPKPRAPIFEGSVDHSAELGTGNAIPEEVALCLSFAADPISGTPQRRRRGRVYLGPFTTSSLDTDPTTGRPIPNPNMVSTVILAAEGLLAANDVDMSWAVWSRVGNSLAAVTNGWVDNAFDTQRRRGADATSRVLFPAP